MAETRSLWNEHEFERDGVRIEVVAQPAVNLALVHNEVPLVQMVRLTNTSDRPIDDATLSLALDGRGIALAPPWNVAVGEPLAPGDQRTWHEFGFFAPAVEHLANLDESHPASLTVSLSRAWGPEVAVAAPIRILAHDEWFNAPLFFESLAAFVQPNTRAITVVLGAAADLLRERSGDASLCGYQQGPERASLIAAAVYEALRGREINYVQPPASFENTGQKVRTTSRVLDGRLGTCVDLAVTYAACLEQAGLHPLLWLVEGHALAGYLREEGSLAHTVITEPNAMINLVESGRAVPVEAAFYDLGEDGSFASAIRHAKRRFRDPDALLGVIDVHAAHRAGTRPLPSGESSDPAPAAGRPPVRRAASSALELPDELLAGPDEDDVLRRVADDAPARVGQWKRALLDLSTRNRLLNLRPSGEVLDLHVPADSLAILDDIVHDGKSISLVAQDDISDLQQLQGTRRAQDLDDAIVGTVLAEDHAVFVALTAQSYVARMRRLQRTARTMLEETGNANLYLTVGALVHRTPSDREARAPLFLLPVKIEGGTGRSAFAIRMDTTSVASPNHCLVEWLRIKHDVRIDALENPRLDHSGIDIVAALPAIRDALVAHQLDVRIDEVSSLAICQFSTFGMWHDLEHSWDVLANSPVVEHLALRPGETFRDPWAGSDAVRLDDLEVDEAEIALPIPADGSQLRAVALAAKGRSFVLEGPPGTGKSQTITNLIAHALAKGRTVLFVAEKQAALDVVKRRLDQVGLTDFTLDLHGRSQRPAEIRAQLKRAIDNLASYDRRGWEAARATLRARHAPLDEYPDRIHARNGVGVSLWGAYENLLQYGDGPAAPISASYVATRGRDESLVKDALRTFARAARTVGLRMAHPWALAGRVGHGVDEGALRSAAADLEVLRERLEARSNASRLLRLTDDPTQLEALNPHLEDRADGVVFDASRLAVVRSLTWRVARDRLLADASGFADQHAGVLGTFTAAFLEHGDTSGLATAAEEAQRGFLGRRRRLDEFEQTVRPLLIEGASLAPAQIRGRVIGIDAARAHGAQLVGQCHDLLGDLAPSAWTPLRGQSDAALSDAFAVVARNEAFARDHGELWRALQQGDEPSHEDVALLEAVRLAWARWRSVLGSGRDEHALWTAGRPWTVAWEQDAPTWNRDVADGGGAAAGRWRQMVVLLDPLREAGLDELRDALLGAAIAASEAEVAYLRGVALASLRERRDAGGLQAFDPALRDGEIADFAAAAAASRTEQRIALPADLLERRPYSGDRLSGKVGELRRRLDAKRGGLSFRQLVERYGEEILQATPCFFVSPASLAQFVAPGSVTFDLVVFDEASQVTVAQAIGALGRGRSAVVVGDSQQMPPTSVGKVRATANPERDDNDDEPEILEDLESILTECVESGLPRVWLSWHYRSQDETLIAFSNAHYYEGKLASLPSPGGDPTAGIELCRVQGHFNREDKHEHRTNRVEADAIVAEIRRRLADPIHAEESIGVVTFNAQQRDMVLNLLEECGDRLVARQLREDASEGIFVKNLENVQGDERDTILFSIAFSKRAEGGPLPLQFGPLGTSGGEKRLNVAITRARRKVLLFASFDPSDIELSRTSSRGIAHLRSYLELAANGPSSLPATGSRGTLGVDHVRETIADAIRGRGYEVASGYGLSDFTLDLVVRDRDTGRWQVAIVLDGPGWARRATVADRDLTPLLLVDLMRWGGLLRLWLPEWLDDREGVLRRVDAGVAEARERELQERARTAARLAEREAEAAATAVIPTNGGATASDVDLDDGAEEGDVVELETLMFSSASPPDGDAGAGTVAPPRVALVRDPHALGAAYVEIQATTLGDRDDLGRTTSPFVRGAIMNAVRDTVEAEGPITTARLARSIGRRYGFDRVAAARQRFILEAVPADRVRTTELGEFVWPTGLDPESWRGYRATPPDVERPLTDVCPEEIINAMAHVCADHVLSDDEGLFRATLAVFGQRRLTGPTTARLDACRDLAIQRSRLVRTASGAWRPAA